MAIKELRKLQEKLTLKLEDIKKQISQLEGYAICLGQTKEEIASQIRTLEASIGPVMTVESIKE